MEVFIVFEILDYVAPSEIGKNVKYYGREAGWIKIAWAFLKVVGKNGKENTERRSRLQLYRIPRMVVPNSQSLCEPGTWLLSPNRIKYSSTLYVTIRALQLPSQLMPTSRSMLAIQGEVGLGNENLSKALISTATGAPLLQPSAAAAAYNKVSNDIANWSRLPGQVCKLPNKEIANVFVGQMGCTRVVFSNKGFILSIAAIDPPSCDYPIVIYDVKKMSVSTSLYGHINVVYDLSWSHDDSALVTASSDATARVWWLNHLSSGSEINSPSSDHAILAHPSFVYSAKFHPQITSVVATGCHDGKIRIWGIALNQQRKLIGLLFQEIDVQAGLVNALEFDPAGHVLFSGTSTGDLSIWHCNVTAQPDHQRCGFTKEWTLDRKIKAREIDGTPINKLIRPKNANRLLVHTRDSAIRFFDLKSDVCTQRFMGHVNARSFSGCALTPCGSFVLAGSEAGTCYVWDAVTSDKVTIYDKLRYTSGVTDVAFHPHEHMVAFCAYGDSQPVLIHQFDEASKFAFLFVEIFTNFSFFFL